MGSLGNTLGSSVSLGFAWVHSGSSPGSLGLALVYSAAGSGRRVHRLSPRVYSFATRDRWVYWGSRGCTWVRLRIVGFILVREGSLRQT